MRIMFKHVRTLLCLFYQSRVGCTEIMYLQFVRILINGRKEIVTDMLQVFLGILYPSGSIIEQKDSLIGADCRNDSVVQVFLLCLVERAVGVKLCLLYTSDAADE